MDCIKLRQDYNIDCKKLFVKYDQQLILINKKDVLEHQIQTSTVDLLDNYTCYHNILFKLKENKTGFLITSNNKGSNIFGTTSKTEKYGIPYFSHTIQLPILGIDLQSKCFLNQLNLADYFGVLRHSSGVIEVYGFEYGLNTNDYVIDLQNTSGVSLINLTSNENELEADLPFIYKSGTFGNENIDFDNLFSENSNLPNGDFNNDFNNDFFI